MAKVDNYSRLFGVPLSVHYLGEEFSELSNQITVDSLTEFRVDPEGSPRSNFGGWHSSFGIDGKYDSFSKLKTIITEHGNLFCKNQGFLDGLECVNMWANLSGPGDMNTPHTHGTDPLTGVFYPVDSISEDGTFNTSYEDDRLPLGIQMCDQARKESGGSLVFTDPAYGKKITLINKNDPDNVSWYHVYPKAGLLLLFPGYVTHFVTPFKENKKRLSISFSLRYGKN